MTEALAPSSVTYVVLDGQPFTYSYPDPEGNVEWEVHPDYAGLPPEFLSKIDWLAEHFEDASCEANGCPVSDARAIEHARRLLTNGASYGMGERVLAILNRKLPAAVGGHLAGDADELAVWAHTTLVRRADGIVIAVCEDCSPESIYA